MSDLVNFTQFINGKAHKIAVPHSKVERLANKVDKHNEAGHFKKSEAAIKPYLSAGDAKVTSKPARAPELAKKGGKKEAALGLITKLSKMDRTRSQIIAQVQHDMEMSYANARHYVVNVANI